MKDLATAAFHALAVNTHRAKGYLFPSILGLIFVAFPGSLHAQFTYTITTNLTVTISGYTGPGGSVIIPSTLSGFPVTSIQGAFYNNQTITNVWIPNTVSNIGGNAFLYCFNLVAINVDTSSPYYSSSDGVLFNKSQSQLVQYPPGKAGSYTVPDTVTDIAAWAMGACQRLTSVVVPTSVTNMVQACTICLALTNAAVGATIIGDSAFEACSNLASLTISNGVTGIGNSTFARCTSLASVVIPDSVTNLGSSFVDCWTLTNVTIGRNVTTIGTYAFFACYNLTSIAIPSSVTYIGDYAFSSTALRSISIPDSVIHLGNYGFANSALTNVTMGQGVTTISGGTFSGCANLGNVTIGQEVTTIGGTAFEGCTSLTNVTMGTSVTTIGGGGWSAFGFCTGLTHFQIGRGVGSIDDYTFQFCSNLTDVVVSKSVTNIGQYAFYNCPSLNRVYFEGAPPAADSTLFNGANISVCYYLPGTPGWGPLFANRPAIPWLPEILTGDSSFGVKNNSFGFNVFWARGQSVVVEGTADVAKPVWIPMATNNLTTGSFYFADPQSTNYPGRFYRAHSL